MFGKGRIITISINPAWDINCEIDGVDWGDHKMIDRQVSVPAGKALNVSKALAYMGYVSVAMGLWGNHDYEDMLTKLRPLSGFIDFQFTTVNGRTRRNVCINDTRNNRQMHLRLSGTLASKPTVKKMADQILKLVDKEDVCVFSGSIPDGSYNQEIVSLVWDCRQKGAHIVLDSSGKTFAKIVDSGQASIISPNLEELEELLSCRIKPEPDAAAKAGKKMLDKAKMILVSMGSAGAVLVDRDGYWHSDTVGVPMPVLNTVACGDYLLAGFIAGLYEDSDRGLALTKGVRLATAFAYGLCDTNEAWELDEQVLVETNYYKF